jgi:hypothetical protein
VKPLAAIVLVAFAAAASPALGLSNSEAEELAAAARANPRSAGSQRIVDLAQSAGKARDLAALDHLISLRHADILQIYTGAYRGDNPGGPSPEIEQRLLREYEDPRISWALMRALWRYENPELGRRLADDVAQLSQFRRERSIRCRIIMTPGGSAHLSGGPAGSIAGLGVVRPSVSTRIDCPPALTGLPNISRAEAALALIGDTELAGVEQRITPLIPDLAAVPPVDEAARDAPGGSAARSMVYSLKSVARLVKARRYRPAGPALIAALDKLPGKELGDFEAAWPLLQALGQLDLREGSETIARWIELRSRTGYSVESSPRLSEMVALLAGARGEAQIDLTGLRDRVLANIPYTSLERVSSAFRAVAKANSR